MKPHKSITKDKGEIERELAEVTFEDVQEALFDGSYFVDHHWSSVGGYFVLEKLYSLASASCFRTTFEQNLMGAI
ncbi:hypothetical protein ACOSP7_004062 [Xanthoceras sorbifolium]